MNNKEALGQTLAPLITMGSHSELSPFRQTDWGGLLMETGLKLSGWQIISPQRYALLSLFLLGLGGLYSQPWLILGGSLLIVWATRRFQLLVSIEHGCILSMSICGVTYIRMSLPLWTPIKIECHGAMSTIWFGSLDSSFHIYELLECHHERATELVALYREGARRAQTSRLVRLQAPQFISSGEWQVSLIELVPLLSGPRAKYWMGESQLSWWAPSTGFLLSGFCFLVLSPFFLFLSVESIWPLLLSLIVTLGLIFGPREELRVSHKGYFWTRRWFCIPLAHRNWSFEAHTSLIHDPVAPHGRHVLIYDHHAPQSVKELGHTWDSDWIWSQLKVAQEKYSNSLKHP